MTTKTSRSSKAKKAPAVQDMEPPALSTTGGSFVLLSDLHAHAWAAFAKGDGGNNSRLQHSLRILRASLERAREKDIPWVFAGDIVHTAGFTLNVVLAELTNVLLDFPDVVKLAVWGNHDARGVGGRILFQQTVLATLSRVVPQFIVLDPSMEGVVRPVPTRGGLTFSGAGYQPRGELLQYAMPSDVGIYHQTIGGTKGPNGFVLEEGVPAEELLKRHRVVVVGHVHHWQYHPAGKGAQMLLIPGSPEHQNFGDEGVHGWWEITIPKGHGAPEATMIPGGSPEFRTVESPREVKNDGHFYRVRSAKAGEALPAGAVAIAPSPTSIENRNLLQGARGDQVLSVWLKEQPPESDIPLERYMDVGRSILGAAEVQNLRPLRLTALSLYNFCSYEEQEFAVHPGTWLVMGRGRDYPSNGAGKSTLFESIFWVLFGRTTKGLTGDGVIRRGQDACEVSARFDGPDGDWLRVTRSRGKASRLEVETPDGFLEGKSVNEIGDKLTQHLGITAELYQALGYFSQEKLLLFASSTDGERKDMLADLIGLSAYQTASSAALAQATQCTRNIEMVDVRMTTAVQLAERERDMRDKAQRDAQTWEAERTARLVQATAAITNFEATKEARRLSMIDASRLRLGGHLTARKAALQKSIDDLTVAIQQPRVLYNSDDLRDAQKAFHDATANVQRVDTERTMETTRRSNLARRAAAQNAQLAEGICPSCHQPVTAEHRNLCMQPLLDEIRGVDTIIAERTAALPALQAIAEECRVRVAAVTEGYRASAEVAAMQSAWSKAQEDLQLLAVEEIQAADAIEDAVDKELDGEHRLLLAAKTRVEAEVNPHQQSVAGAEQRIARAEAEAAAHHAESVRLCQEAAIYDYWRKGFSKQGIQSLLVDEVAGVFNAVRGDIFPALTQGIYDVQFSTLSQTAKGEIREKTDFAVFEHGVQVEYAGLSGGQRRRIDVGVMLTLVKAVSRWMQVPGMLGLLVLDEVFGFLDGSGAEGLMEALQDVREQIPAIFVVSHEPQLQALFPEIIMVAQNEDGVSRILTDGEQA